MRSSSMRSENSGPAAAAAGAAAPPPNSAKDMSLGQSNVFKLLARRELSPQTKKTPKRFWVKVTGDQVDSCCLKSEIAKDARQELRSWAEAESLLHLSAKYCPLQPPPRSTIAAAFSPDGKTLASTHGDHTVKIIDCQTGKCLKVLTGHRRTPWVVRFHPLYPEVVASGSLDHEVRLWDAKTAACIGSRDFYRPIASIAFHAQGEFLAVASGHKLYIWYYSRRGEASSPMIILRTRRSLRAVHFHPHGAPLLLTAEVNDLNSSDPTMTIATCAGYSRYPPPTIYVADPNPPYHSNSGNESPFVSMPFLIFPSVGRGESGPTSQQQDIQPQRADSSTSVRLLTYSTPSGQYELVLSPIQSPAREEPQNNINNDDSNNNTNNSSLHRETDNSSTYQPSANVSTEIDRQAEEAANQFFPFGDPTHWELPFLQGWLIGQSQVGQQAAEDLSSYGAVGGPSPVLPPEVPHGSSIPGVSGRSGLRQRISQSHTRLAATTGGNPGSAAAFGSIPVEQGSARAFVGPAQPEAAAELPCTVKLRIWSHDVKNPCVALDADKCRLTIPHVVLCSEMGAHFSPCGRFLAACVACIQINTDTDPGLQGQVQHEFMGASTSPTRHPIAVHPVIYELRIYSLEEATFGSVLASRAIRAAHCLTSIQFSPTSEHLLLAYGRRHNSLLKSVVIDGDTTVSIYTILEIYRVSDMELVRVLPSAEDEVNVASFHPSVGGGFIYGTKEGKLRILQCDSSYGLNNDGSRDLGNNMPEVQRYASES